MQGFRYLNPQVSHELPAAGTRSHPHPWTALSAQILGQMPTTISGWVTSKDCYTLTPIITCLKSTIWVPPLKILRTLCNMLPRSEECFVPIAIGILMERANDILNAMLTLLHSLASPLEEDFFNFIHLLLDIRGFHGRIQSK